MARPEKLELDVPAAVGTGQAANVFRYRHKTVQVGGVFEGSLAVEGSLDGDEYAALGAAVTAPGFMLVPETVEFVRVRVTALASGKPEVALAGFDERAV